MKEHRYDKLFAKLKKLQRIHASQLIKTAKRLKLPLIKSSLPDMPMLSMDDYLKFVMFNLK